jgi:hypothetical protein
MMMERAMIDTDDEAAYFLARARQEAEAAAASAHPTAASAHRILSMNYSAKALLAHVDADDGRGAFPQFTKAAARR